jgi:16S rRNA processing protein RimM
MAHQDENRVDEAPDDKVILGRIAGVYGVKGWVKVYSYTDPMESIVDYSPWFIRPEDSLKTNREAAWTKVRLKAGKRHAKTVVAKLEHCNDRDAAMSYIGSEIAIERQQLEELKDKDEYYWRDLIGLRVINQQDIELGTVKGLLETGANDVLVVSEETEADNKERLIPWTMGQAVISVDLEQGVIEVDWDPDF